MLTQSDMILVVGHRTSYDLEFNRLLRVRVRDFLSLTLHWLILGLGLGFCTCKHDITLANT